MSTTAPRLSLALLALTACSQDPASRPRDGGALLDLAPRSDGAVARDASVPVDATAPEDLATPPDSASTVDATASPDLASIPCIMPNRVSTMIASNRPYPSALAVDSGNLYWLEQGTYPNFLDGAVVKYPLPGGPAQPLASSLDSPVGIALDARAVYWSSSAGGTIQSVPIGGGTPTMLASGQNQPYGLAVDEINLFWVDRGAAGSSSGALMRVPLAGGAPVALATGLAVPWYVVLDPQYAYVDNPMVGGTLSRIPLAGGAPQVLATGNPGGPLGIALRGGVVYFADDYTPNGSIQSVPAAGGNVTTIAANQDGAWSLAVDDTDVYWTNLDLGVFKAHHDGSCLQQLATANQVSSVIVDATSVYYAGGDMTGYVVRLTPK